MYRSAALLIAVALVLTGCADAASRGPVAPSEPLRELYDEAQRQPPDQINAHVYGSFGIRFGSEEPSVITSGPANFPGHPPAGPGTCQDGRWINAQGKPTAGTLEHPHPHCISATSVMEVVLEPISACYSAFDKTACGGYPRAIEALVLGTDRIGPLQVYVENFDDRGTLIPVTTGVGTIAAYAIDASTLRTTPRRVGILKFELNTLSIKGNIFEADCSLDSDIGIPCLNGIITASYSPLAAPDGVGSPTSSVPGFLWFTPATTPYNYGR